MITKICKEKIRHTNIYFKNKKGKKIGKKGQDSNKKGQTGRAVSFFRTATPTSPLEFPLIPPLPILAPPASPPPLINHVSEEVDDPLRDLGSWLDHHIDRILISRYFTEVSKSPPKREWKGKGGTLSLIRATLPNILYGEIVQVVSDTTICESKRKKYNSLRKNENTRGIT